MQLSTVGRAIIQLEWKCVLNIFQMFGVARLRCDEISSTHTQSRARPFDIIGSLKCSTVSALIICASSEAHPFFTSEAGGSHTLRIIQHNVCEMRQEQNIREELSLQ
jgi:hypothetical protein